MNNYKKVLAELNVSSIDDLNLLQRKTKEFLLENFKDTIDSNEIYRIILGDYDLYNVNDKHGLKLSSIQNICDDVNISRCFVEVATTNPDIQQEINEISKVDDKFQRLSFELMSGNFTKRKVDEFVYRYGSVVPTKVNLNNLSEKEVHWLTDSKVFCMYPWIHIYASPNGAAQPCCVWDHSEKMCSTKTQTLEQVYNSPAWRKLRLDMMNGIPTSGCEPCYEQERNGFFSNRQSSNKHHGHHVSRATQTHKDGTSDTFEMTYWDIRFSNLCNLSCRSCGHIFSSSWYKDQVKLAGSDWAKKNKPLIWAGRHETDMLEQLMEHIDYVEQIYFAGGEPLIMDEHYHILEELERREKFDVKLVYNTNFTKTKLKDRYVFDYWRKFKSVAVGASLDAMGPRAEYIRAGTDWKEVEQNRQMMMEQCPNVDFYISPTLSIQNALHIPDFHRNWVERGFISPQDLNINILLDPKWLRMDIAPQHYKDKIKEKFIKHLEWLKPLDSLQRATQGFESAIRALDNDMSAQLPVFWEKMNKLDEFRNENILEAIPELDEIRINN